jgi:uncharacterized membrane protein YeaQ/YmgE (transglycosylase-associated protein family)
MSLVMTAIVGIVGSFLGGLIGNVIAGRSVLELHSAGFIGSIIGALLVMFLMGFVGRGRAAV